MAPYNFEGDIAGISEGQLEFINKVLEEQGFQGSKVTFELVGKAGDNYAANVRRIKIERDNGIFSIIAKIAPTIESLRAMVQTAAIFKNEHVMYTEVLPKLVQLQKDAEVSDEEQLRFAKCYGSKIEEFNEVILLEDLNTSNFVMLSRFKSLSNECVKSVMRNFGIFHSLSYVLKKKDPDTYNRYKASLVDIFPLMSEFMQFTINNLETTAQILLDEPEHKNMVKNKMNDILKTGPKLAKYEEGNKYSVIQQGDAWTNNIMFRFEGETLKESVMIDYQQSKNNNPVCDILYAIFSCTDHETRSKYYYEWIDYYHSEMEKSLSNFGLKVNFVYPRDQLDADLKRYAKIHFGLAILMSGMMSIKPEDAAVFQNALQSADVNIENVVENMNLADLDAETVNCFKSKIVGLINTVQQFGLL